MPVCLLHVCVVLAREPHVSAGSRARARGRVGACARGVCARGCVGLCVKREGLEQCSKPPS